MGTQPALALPHAHHSPKPYVRQAFRQYLECGIFAHGFGNTHRMVQVDPDPPHIAPARGPPLWDDCDVQTD